MTRKYPFHTTWLMFIICLTLAGCITRNKINPAGRDRLFNEKWKFIRDNPAGAEKPGYDDSKWIMVDLPHDYSMMDLPGEDGKDQIGPFSRKSPGGGRSCGQVLGGTGWYRKHLTLNRADTGKKAILRFDGVYMETGVWVNGKPAGNHKNGYTPFWFDITDLLNQAGEDNVIAVKVDNTGQNTRWYSGSGIYRNVHLTLTNAVHVAVWGVRVTTPDIKDNQAIVEVAVNVRNEGEKPTESTIVLTIIDPDGRPAGKTEKTCKLDAHGFQLVNHQIPVRHPSLWSIESPKMYQAEITILVHHKITDRYLQPFGIRSLDFSAGKGFLLNGNAVKLKGGCMHHDNGLLGSAAIDRAEERRVEIMKANGYNAIRCSHNPPSETFLNACDKLGILVIDEFSDIWEAPKNPDDYSRFFREWWKKDVTCMVMRDRNHPGIIMWSIGNEILEKNDTSGLLIGRQLVTAFKEPDNSRPVTEAVNDNWMKRGKEWDKTAPAFALLDVCGYNYERRWMESDHAKYPDRIMFGSESFPAEAFHYWLPVKKHSYVIGDFVWTAMDYLGEAALGKSQYVDKKRQKNVGKPLAGDEFPSGLLTPEQELMAVSPGIWPWFGAWCGDIDITGEKKPQKAYRDVLWDNSKLEMNVHSPVPEGKTEVVGMWGWPDEWPCWNWKGNEGIPLQVRVFTKGDKVKLELNGKTIGEKAVSIDSEYIAVFEVPYQPGVLKATAYKNEMEIAVKTLETTGNADGIRLKADRNTILSDRNDLAFITIEAVDKNGLVVPDAAVKVKLTLTGNGELAASGNACPLDMESVNRSIISTFRGKAQAIVRPFIIPGTITLKAESEDLAQGEITLRNQPSLNK